MEHWKPPTASSPEGNVSKLSSTTRSSSPPNAAAVGHAYGSVQESLRNHCGILVHVKTKIWNRAGNRPVICDALERMAQQVDPRARVWLGSQVPTDARIPSWTR